MALYRPATRERRKLRASRARRFTSSMSIPTSRSSIPRNPEAVILSSWPRTAAAALPRSSSAARRSRYSRISRSRCDGCDKQEALEAGARLSAKRECRRFRSDSGSRPAWLDLGAETLEGIVLSVPSVIVLHHRSGSGEPMARKTTTSNPGDAATEAAASNSIPAN